MSAERLQKILARAGLGSRRSCEALIQAGRVTVNGRTARLGDQADPAHDEIRLDGERLPAAERLVYVALNKPPGVVSSREAQGRRRTVVDLVDLPERLYPVGRLDLESEGLILLTNDGQAAQELAHPRYGHEKEYRVLVEPVPDADQLELWRRGLVLGDGDQTRPARVWVERRSGKGAWLGVVLTEGRKRQIRESAMRLGLSVRRLIRTRIASLQLGALRPGEWRLVREPELRHLLQRKTEGAGGATARPRRSAGRDKLPPRSAHAPGAAGRSGHGNH